MKLLISLSLAAFMLASCMTERKRADVFHRYARENPTELADICADEYPVKVVTTKGKTDTVTMRDTLRVKVPVPVPGGTDTLGRTARQQSMCITTLPEPTPLCRKIQL